MGESKGGWLPFQAAQHFTASGPGFVWEAHISMMPLVSVGVRDGYVNGQGGMQAKMRLGIWKAMLQQVKIAAS